MKTLNWSGIYSAVTTQFHEDGSLDTEMYSKNIRFQVDAGIDAVIIGGSLGESSTITHDERLELFSLTKAIVDKSFPVLINIAESSTSEAIILAQRAEASGADGLMLLPPLLYKATEKEVLRFYTDVASNTSLPILVYNNPVDYRIEITADMFSQLLKHDNIQAVKESTRDTANVTKLKNAFGDRLKVLTGVDTIAAESLIMGADGWVAGLVNAFPGETVAIYNLIKNRRIHDAIDIHRWFLPMLELDVSPQLVQNIKLAQQLVGVGNEHVRPPRLKLDHESREHVIRTVRSCLERRPNFMEAMSK